jgi:hypothetical protein
MTTANPTHTAERKPMLAMDFASGEPPDPLHNASFRQIAGWQGREKPLCRGGIVCYGVRELALGTPCESATVARL